MISPLNEIVGADSSAVPVLSTTLVVNPSCKGNVGEVSLCAGAGAFVEWFVIRGVEVALGFGPGLRGVHTKRDWSFLTSNAVARNSNIRARVANAYFHAWRRMSKIPTAFFQKRAPSIETAAAKLSCRALETSSFFSRSVVSKNRRRN